MQHRLTLLASVLASTLCSTLLMAQTPSGPCTEKAIREAIQKNTIKYTEDTFFWSGAFDKPLIGNAAAETGQHLASVEFVALR